MRRSFYGYKSNSPSKRGRPNKYDGYIINVNRYLPWFMIKETIGKGVLNQGNKQFSDFTESNKDATEENPDSAKGITPGKNNS